MKRFLMILIISALPFLVGFTCAYEPAVVIRDHNHSIYIEGYHSHGHFRHSHRYHRHRHHEHHHRNKWHHRGHRGRKHHRGHRR